MSPTSSWPLPLESAAQQGLGWQLALVIHLPEHWLMVVMVQRKTPVTQQTPVTAWQLAGAQVMPKPIQLRACWSHC